MRLVQVLAAAVERKIDPHFNPNDPPARNIAPPGWKYASGVAPSAFTDEKTRKEYEAKHQTRISSKPRLWLSSRAFSTSTGVARTPARESSTLLRLRDSRQTHCCSHALLDPRSETVNAGYRRGIGTLGAVRDQLQPGHGSTKL